MRRAGGRLAAGTRLGRIAVGLAMAIRAAAAVSQEPKEARTRVSKRPLSAEQLAVYRAVLSDWITGYAADQPPGPEVPLKGSGPFGDADCAKGLELEDAPAVVHRFRQEDLAQLGGDRTYTLVDADKQKQEVENNDPEKTIRNGGTIGDAVHNGFAHGLATLSEIQFDKKHMSAIVSYGFFCGSLCGNGGTVVLEKKDGVWHRSGQCHDWISQLAPPGWARRPGVRV